jgi:hypothetical protein
MVIIRLSIVQRVLLQPAYSISYPRACELHVCTPTINQDMRMSERVNRRTNDSKGTVNQSKTGGDDSKRTVKELLLREQEGSRTTIFFNRRRQSPLPFFCFFNQPTKSSHRDLNLACKVLLRSTKH